MYNQCRERQPSTFQLAYYSKISGEIKIDQYQKRPPSGFLLFEGSFTPNGTGGQKGRTVDSMNLEAEISGDILFLDLLFPTYIIVIGLCLSACFNICNVVFSSDHFHATK